MLPRVSVRSALARSPTVETLAVFLFVFAAQSTLSVLQRGLGIVLFALARPVAVRPWTLVTSVYAHAGVDHLLANALVLVLIGLPVERVTTRRRFHAFFVATGALAGLAQVTLGGLVGPPQVVLGASGAVFALVGYAAAGNPLSAGILARLGLSPVQQGLAFALLAVAVTLATGAPGVALIAHFTGLFLGLVAGRVRLLSTAETSDAGRPSPENTRYK